jgi:hypothetical protein
MVSVMSTMSFEESLEHFSEVIELSVFLVFIERFSNFEERVVVRNNLLTLFTEVEVSTSRTFVSDSVDRANTAGFACSSVVGKTRNDLSSRLFTLKYLFFENWKHVIDPFINHLGDNLIEEALHSLHMLLFVARLVSRAFVAS